MSAAKESTVDSRQSTAGKIARWRGGGTIPRRRRWFRGKKIHSGMLAGRYGQERTDAGVAGPALSAGSDVQRGGGQLRDLLAERPQGGALPLRFPRGQGGVAAHHHPRADGPGLA